MATKDHYVSKFHISGFADPDAPTGKSQWTWMLSKEKGTIAKKSPKNFAWRRGMFSNMHLNFDPPVNMEKYLSESIEGPASKLISEIACQHRILDNKVAPEITRYLAWAAARSMTVQELYQKWADAAPAEIPNHPVDENSKWLLNCKRASRVHKMEKQNEIKMVSTDLVDKFRKDGWRLILEGDDLAETIHLQAIYFRQLLPKLAWAVITPPQGHNFVLGDRPVFWKVGENFTLEPKHLTSNNALTVAPLSSKTALVGARNYEQLPTNLSAPYINYMSMTAARRWIAGPTRQCIDEMLAFSFNHLASMLVHDA